MDVAEDSPWWSCHQPAKGFEEEIDTILPEVSSWSKEMRIWGDERGHAILVVYRSEEKREVEQIEIRIDLSKYSKEFVFRACRWATSLDCLAWTKAYEVIIPEYNEVETAIRKSRAMKFMLNPSETLQSLEAEEF
ncbi:hypothetical protein ACFPT7_23415 [Acidicapsa dinghuensis]|uniref:Uncharacterized protein n=1 Tax=Acidicapsa dinghuensis TaxID=2218256 RepID=A0ABW1EMY2_9BACT|nr:hypothetical protein [Acidicapsa dinghuensis]